MFIPDAVSAILPHFDPASAVAGAIAVAGATGALAALKKAVAAAPAVLVSYIKERVRAQAAAGRISDPVLRLVKGQARAAFDWVDKELPEKPGAEKMEGLLDHMALVPYVGVLVRANRAAVRDLLQAGYVAVKQEAHAEAAPPPPTP